MESNWQWNVAFLGLSGLGYNRAARWLVDSAYWIVGFEDRSVAGYALYYWPMPSLLPAYIGTFANGGLHFPYGVPVSPD